MARGEVGVGLARQEELVFSLHATGMATGVHGCGARRQCGQMLSPARSFELLARTLKDQRGDPCHHPGGDGGGSSDQGGRWR